MGHQVSYYVTCLFKSSRKTAHCQNQDINVIPVCMRVYAIVQMFGVG